LLSVTADQTGPTITVTASGTLPTGPVTPVMTAVADSPTSVRLDITDAQDDGEGCWYEIQFGAAKNGKVKTWMTTERWVSPEDSAYIYGLLPGIDYQFRARTTEWREIDGNGQRVYSEWSIPATSKTTIAVAPPALSEKIDKATAVNKANKDKSTIHSVSVSWGAVESVRVGNEASYIVTYTIPSGIKGVPGKVVQDVVRVAYDGTYWDVVCEEGGASISEDGKVITYKAYGLPPGTSCKLTIVGQNTATGAVTKAISLSQKTLNAKVKAPAGLKAAEKPSIDTVKLTWKALPDADGYYIEVWSPKTKTDAPQRVTGKWMSAAEYAAATSGGIANGWTFKGLTAGTEYTFAVLAEKSPSGYDWDTNTFTDPGYETAFACKAIATAKYPAPKINLMQGKGTVPSFTNGLTGTKYQHYEVYYVDANKKEVCIGTVSLPTPPSAKEKVDLGFSMMTPNANFHAFDTWVSGLGKKSVKFVVKAVTMDTHGNIVNRSAGGSSSMRADYLVFG
jgi:hypothetical protein